MNKTIQVAGKVLPRDCKGCCNIVKIKFCALPKSVFTKIKRIILKIIKIKATGIKASNGLATFCGTASGSLIVHPLFKIKRYISTAKQDEIIAKNKPEAPKLSIGKPLALSASTIKGVNIK